MCRVNLSSNFEMRKNFFFFFIQCCLTDRVRWVFASSVWMLELDNSGSHWQYSTQGAGGRVQFHSWRDFAAGPCHLLGTTGSCWPLCHKPGFSRLTGPCYPRPPPLLLKKGYIFRLSCLRTLDLSHSAGNPLTQTSSTSFRGQIFSLAEQDGLGMSLQAIHLSLI